MLNITKPRWALSENLVTPEHVFLNRRQILAGATALGAASIAGQGLALTPKEPWTPDAPQNPAFVDPGRPVTPEDVNTTYNNFYEFGSHKQIHDAAEALQSDPWTVNIDGLVEKELQIGIEDLIAKMPVQERIYRHRCVEAWSMVVPWIGFPLADLVKLAQPKSEAKYVQFQTFHDPDTARGQRQHWYPWPYTEGCDH